MPKFTGKSANRAKSKMRVRMQITNRARKSVRAQEWVNIAMHASAVAASFRANCEQCSTTAQHSREQTG